MDSEDRHQKGIGRCQRQEAMEKIYPRRLICLFVRLSHVRIVPILFNGDHHQTIAEGHFVLHLYL